MHTQTAWYPVAHSRIHIYLHEVLLYCVSLIELHPLTGATSYIEETRIQSRMIISEMVSGICASTDFCLGDINSVGDPAPTEYRMPLCDKSHDLDTLASICFSPKGKWMQAVARLETWVYFEFHGGSWPRVLWWIETPRILGTWDNRGLDIENGCRGSW